jgi:N-sulfoglucosamine sulfohydrolase
VRLTLTALAVLLSAGSTIAADPAKQWNLLLITADDLNADSAGWAGNKLGATPNLDGFARAAYRFVNSHVTVPIRQPGRQALLTGRVPHRNGGLGFNPIRRDVPTLVEVMRDAGYYTAAIAKVGHMAPADKFPWHATGSQKLVRQPTKFAERPREMLGDAAKEKKPAVPVLRVIPPGESEVRLVDQGGSGQRLARLLPDQPGGGELPQLVVHEREQVGRGAGVAGLDGGKDPGDVGHDRRVYPPGAGRANGESVRPRNAPGRTCTGPAPRGRCDRRLHA